VVCPPTVICSSPVVCPPTVVFSPPLVSATPSLSSTDSTLESIFNPEQLAVILLKNQPQVWEECRFDLTKFINDLIMIKELEMSHLDAHNFSILISAEIENNNSQLSNMTTDALSDFGKRFGPWNENIVQNVRNFIEAGAKDWFIGKCDREKANTKLESNDRSSNNIYFIRSVTPVLNDNLYYVFALSYRIDGKVYHLRIYRENNSKFLCVINVDQEIVRFLSFKQIIEWVLIDPTPVGDKYFKDLQLSSSKISLDKSLPCDKYKITETKK